ERVVADHLSRRRALLDAKLTDRGAEAARNERRERQLGNQAAIERERRAEQPGEIALLQRHEAQRHLDAPRAQVAAVDDLEVHSARRSQLPGQQKVADVLLIDRELQVGSATPEGRVDAAFEFAVPLGPKIL